MLVTVYFKKTEKPGYAKAIINKVDVPMFVKMGAVQTQAEAQKATTVDFDVPTQGTENIAKNAAAIKKAAK